MIYYDFNKSLNDYLIKIINLINIILTHSFNNLFEVIIFLCKYNYLH